MRFFEQARFLSDHVALAAEAEWERYLRGEEERHAVARPSRHPSPCASVTSLHLCDGCRSYGLPFESVVERWD